MAKGKPPVAREDVSRAQPVIIYPSWMDGPYMVTAAFATAVKTVTTDALGRATIPANARRFGLVIFAPGGIATPVSYGPQDDQLTYRYGSIAPGESAHMTIFDWGPIVGYQLYVGCSAGAQVGYQELQLQ